MRVALVLLIVFAIIMDSALAAPKGSKKGKHKSRRSRERPLRIELKGSDIPYGGPPRYVNGYPPYATYPGDNRPYYDSNGAYIYPNNGGPYPNNGGPYPNNGGPMVVYPNGNQYAQPSYVQPAYGPPAQVVY